MPCGLEPHQYDLHEHLFRGRHAGYIPLGRRMGALRLAGRCGCRSAALRRLAVAHAPQRKIAPQRSAAVFRPYTRNPSQPAAGASAYPGRKPHRFRRCVRMISSLRLQPPLAPVSVRECRPKFPRTGKDPHASAKPTPSVLSHEFPVFTPMLRRPICLPPSGNAARTLRNRKPKPIPDPSPASPDAPGPCIPPPIPPDAPHSSPIRCRPRRPELPENGLRKIQTVLFIN